MRLYFPVIFTMKNTYFSSLTLQSFLIVALLFFLSACEEKFPDEPDSDTGEVAPTIVSVNAILNQTTQQFFLTAEISDPQGQSDIDSVSYEFFGPDSIGLYATGTLNDDGSDGDIIIKDGLYSALIPPLPPGLGFGEVKFLFSAVDLESNISDSAEFLYNLISFAPRLRLVSVTNIVTAGDTIFLEVMASDSNGLADIFKITYEVLPPNETLTVKSPLFFLRDDGAFGDKIAGDAVYSVKQATNPTSEGGSTGVFTFIITAEDFSGLKSDELLVPVTLTD